MHVQGRVVGKWLLDAGDMWLDIMNGWIDIDRLGSLVGHGRYTSLGWWLVAVLSNRISRLPGWNVDGDSMGACCIASHYIST